MAKKIRIDLHLPGINELMKSAPVQEDLNKRAEKIAAAAGDGFVAEQGSPHPWIARAYVYADTIEAMQAEATDKVLTRAIDAGRDGHG